MDLETFFIECDGDCGSKIELTTPKTRRPASRKLSAYCELDAVARALGWVRRKHGTKTEVYCPFCQERARRIVGE
jgi:hypothetical protein